MKATKLLNIYEEPTEEALEILMHEVSIDVKEKVLKTKAELGQNILFEIEKANNRIEKIDAAI